MTINPSTSIVRIRDRRFRSLLTKPFTEAFTRIPQKDAELIRSSLRAVHSGHRDPRGKVAVTEWSKADNRCTITVFREKFDGLSREAKLGVIVHELAHVNEAATWGLASIYFTDIFGDGDMDGKASMEWGFVEEVDAMKKELGMPHEPLVEPFYSAGYGGTCSICQKGSNEGYVVYSDDTCAMSILARAKEAEGRPVAIGSAAVGLSRNGRFLRVRLPSWLPRGGRNDLGKAFQRARRR